MNKNDPYLGTKTVRMFYHLVLKHVIPHNRTMEWKVDFCESLEFQLKALLEPQDFQVAFDSKAGFRPAEKQQLTYFIPFLVSRVHEFKAEDIIIPKPGYIGFNIEARALSLVQETLAQDIRDTLGAKVAFHELVFIMATSRSFAFDIYYEGSFRVKREFSDDDIESEDGVRNALESFFDEIKSAIEPFGFQVTSTPSTHRRSRDNEYLFRVYYEVCMGFKERDVHGEGCYAIRGDASTDEVNYYVVDFDNTLLDGAVDDAKAILDSVLEENLPYNTDLISCEISYVDDSEEAFDIDDELISYES